VFFRDPILIERRIYAMSIWILYGLVIVFLLAFPLLVLASVQSPKASVQEQKDSASTAHIDKVSYGLALAFLVLFSLLTFAIQRRKGSN
jgi:hypothetical protein